MKKHKHQKFPTHVVLHKLDTFFLNTHWAIMTITLRSEQLREASQQWTEERGGAYIKGRGGRKGAG